MPADDLVLLGIVGAPHGVKGEVRIKTFTGDPLAIGDYGPLFDEQGRSFEIADLRPAKEVVVARLKGVASREAAELLTGVKLHVERSRLPVAEDEDEFLHADLVGCAVTDSASAVLGEVRAVANYGAGDLLDIELPDGRSVLMPFTKVFAPHVDLAAKRIEVAPPVGLFEVDDDK